MQLFILAIVSALIYLTIHNSVVACYFFLKLINAKKINPKDHELPKAAILMGLKGSDPDLQESLERLMQLDYPEYELFIVADSKTDSSWETVTAAIEATNSEHVHLEEYYPSPATGPVNSTNSKQMQSIQKLDESFDIVAMADGDLMPEPDWLREMVAPIVRSDKVVATFGNRWFLPEGNFWGSYVRYLWNVGAVASMYFLNMPWGGCFAMKMSVIKELNLVEHWSKIIAFDAATPGALASTDYQIQFVPTMFVANREECRLSFCLNFFQRQLLWTRLYHFRWWLAASYAFLTGATTLLALLCLPLCFSLDSFVLGYQLMGSLFIYWIGHVLVAILIHLGVMQASFKHNQPRWLTITRVSYLFLIFPLTQIIQWLALIAAIFCKSVTWRGIRLEIHSPTEIKMVDLSTEVDPSTEKSSRESL